MVYQFSSWICLIAAQTSYCQEAGNGKRIISNGNSTKMVWCSPFKFVLIHYSLWWMQLVVETVSWSQHKNLIFQDRYKATDFYISLWLQQLHSWLAEEALKAWGPWKEDKKFEINENQIPSYTDGQHCSSQQEIIFYSSNINLHDIWLRHNFPPGLT